MDLSQVSTLNKAKKQQECFNQEFPHFVCQQSLYKRRCKCRDHRCSLQCRQNWAFKKAAILNWQIQRVSHTHYIYFGNLDSHDLLSKTDHKAIRTRFMSALNAFKKRRNCEVKILLVSEISADLTIHYHYAMYSTVAITQQEVKSLWSNSCLGKGSTVQHRSPQYSIRQAANYMFKTENRGFIRLFNKNFLFATWGSRPFFEISQEEIWKRLRDQWFGKTKNENLKNNHSRKSIKKSWRKIVNVLQTIWSSSTVAIRETQICLKIINVHRTRIYPDSKTIKRRSKARSPPKFKSSNNLFGDTQIKR